MTSAPGPLLGSLPGSKPFFVLLFCLVFLTSFLLWPQQSVLASETLTMQERVDKVIRDYDRPGARALVTTYLKTHPADPDILCMQARYALTSNKTDEAEKLYRRALSVSPKHGRAMTGLSYCEIARNDYKNAYATGIKAMALWQLDPIYVFPEPNLLKNMQLLNMKSGHMKEAAALGKQVRLVEYAKKARDFREQGVLDKSLEILDPLLKSDPSLSYAHLLRGVVLANQGEHQRAIKDFDAAITQQPNATCVYYFRGDSYNELGNKAKAIESWRQILKLHPIAFPNLVAFCYIAMSGRFREHFEPNDETPVNRADIYYLCGTAETDLHHYDQAASDFTQCIALDGGEYKAYFARATVYERLKKDALVRADLDKAIQINKNYIEAYLERAKILEKKGDSAGAMADYGRVIAVNPGDFGSYILRADLAARLKKYDQALSDFGQAIKLSPTDDDPLIGRAKVYANMGRFDEALVDYKKAMKLNPQDKAVVVDAIAKLEKQKKNPALSVR